MGGFPHYGVVKVSAWIQSVSHEFAGLVCVLPEWAGQGELGPGCSRMAWALDACAARDARPGTAHGDCHTTRQPGLGPQLLSACVSQHAFSWSCSCMGPGPSARTVHPLSTTRATPHPPARPQEDYVMIKGACPGVKRRVITLRKSLFPQTSRNALEEVKLKFVDTSRCGTSASGSPGSSGSIRPVVGSIGRFPAPQTPFLSRMLLLCVVLTLFSS